MEVCEKKINLFIINQERSLNAIIIFNYLEKNLHFSQVFFFKTFYIVFYEHWYQQLDFNSTVVHCTYN